MVVIKAFLSLYANFLPEIHYLSIYYKFMIKFPFLFVLQGMPSIFLQTVIIQHSELLFSSPLKYFKLPY